MKKLFKFKVAAFALAGFFNSSVFAQDTSAFMDRVLVIVNEDVITQSEFDYRMETVAREFSAENPPPANLAEQLLDSMISDRMQVQEANRRGIGVSEEELDAAIERFASQQNASLDQLKSTLEAEGQPFFKFRESVRDTLVISRLTDFYARTRVVVPDYEIDVAIEQAGLGADNSEYLISRILLKDPSSNTDLAQRIRDEIDDGLSFQQAVLSYSEAPDAQDGGLIGWRKPDNLPTEWAEALKDLEAGQVSQVISTGNALHILKMQERKGERTEIIQTKVSHILIKAESKVAKSQATKRLIDLRKRIENGESFDDLARIFSDDTGSAANGGSLGWVSPGEMVRPFEEGFNQIAMHKVSEPIDTQFGMHILVVEDRRKKNVTEQIARGRAEQQLRRQRADREFGQWVRELLEGAYVEHVAKPTI